MVQKTNGANNARRKTRQPAKENSLKEKANVSSQGDAVPKKAKFDAFISYSSEADRNFAPVLRQALHRLGKRWYELRALRIFLDQSDLSANPDLWATIQQGLEESEFFVLLASEKAAQSHWVGKEVEWWLTHRPLDKLIIVWTSGTIVEESGKNKLDWEKSTALPSVLRGHITAIPKFIDLRWAKETEALSLRQNRFRGSMLDLAAPIHNLTKDELDGEDIRAFRNTRRLSLGAIVTLTTLLGLSIYFGWNANQRRKEAERANRTNVSQLLAMQSREMLQSAPVRSVILAAEAVQTALRAPSFPVPTAAHRALRNSVENVSGIGVGIWSSATSVKFAPGNKRLLIATEGGALFRWELPSPHYQLNLESLAGFAGSKELVQDERLGRSAIVSDDGNWMVLDGGEGEAKLWDLRKGDLNEFLVLKHEERAPKSPRKSSGDEIKDALASVREKAWERRVKSFTVEPDGRWALLLSKGDYSLTVDSIQLWSLESPALMRLELSLPDRDSKVTSLALSPAGDLAVAGLNRGNALFWKGPITNVPTGVLALADETHGISALSFAADGSALAVGGSSGTFAIWNLPLESHSTPWISKKLKGTITAVSFLDSISVVVCSSDGTALVITPDSEVELERHGKSATSICIRSNLLITGDSDGAVRIVDLPVSKAKPDRKFQGHDAAIHSIDVSSDGRWLATGAVDGTARLWPIESAGRGADPILLIQGKPQTRHDDTTPSDRMMSDILNRMSPPGISVLAAADDLRWVLTGSRSEESQLWNLSENQSRILPQHKGGVEDAVSLLDGKLLATLSHDGLPSQRGGKLRLWDVQSTTNSLEPVLLGDPEERILDFSVGPDGRLIAGVSDDGVVRIWRLSENEPPRSIFRRERGPGMMTSVGLGKDARWIASGNIVGFVRFWDTRSDDEEPKVDIEVHQGRKVTAVALSSDGRWAATGGEDNRGFLWDLKSGRPILRESPLKFEGIVNSFAFTSDGKFLVSHSAGLVEEKGGSVQLWDLSSRNPEANSTTLESHESGISGFAVSPDGRWIVTGHETGSTLLWDLRSPSLAAVILKPHYARVSDVLMSKDGRFFFTSSADGGVHIHRLGIEDLLELAGNLAGWNLSDAEWREFITEVPQSKTFPSLPVAPWDHRHRYQPNDARSKDWP